LREKNSEKKNALLNLEIDRTKIDLQDIVNRLTQPSYPKIIPQKDHGHINLSKSKSADEDNSKTPKRSTSLGDILKQKNALKKVEVKQRKGSVTDKPQKLIL